jgi:quercetin dioxygenase-like cupin family protein
MDQDRLRRPPRERFAGVERVFDLGALFAGLASESVERQGHMQKTVYKHGRLTSAVFAFERAGRLERHRVEGEAVLLVLEGELEVAVDGEKRRVAGGQMMLLDPGVEHEIEARERSQVVMHVVLEG